MSFTERELVQAAGGRSRFGNPSGGGEGTAESAAYDALTRWLRAQLGSRRGANIPSFGRVSWRTGPDGRACPHFSMLEAFARQHGLRHAGAPPPAGPDEAAPCDDLSHAKLLRHAPGLSRDECGEAVRKLLAALGTAAGSGKAVDVQLGVGTFKARGRQVELVLKPSYAAPAAGSGQAAPSPAPSAPATPHLAPSPVPSAMASSSVAAQSLSSLSLDPRVPVAEAAQRRADEQHRRARRLDASYSAANMARKFELDNRAAATRAERQKASRENAAFLKRQMEEKAERAREGRCGAPQGQGAALHLPADTDPEPLGERRARQAEYRRDLDSEVERRARERRAAKESEVAAERHTMRQVAAGVQRQMWEKQWRQEQQKEELRSAWAEQLLEPRAGTVRPAARTGGRASRPLR